MPVKVLLQEVRKSRGISQNELARLIKMSPQNIQKIEQGDAKSLTFNTLGKFCQALNCQPGDLLIYEHDAQVNAQQTKINKPKVLSRDSHPEPVIKQKTSFGLGSKFLTVQNCF